jgi:hypothetical protein
MIKPNLIFSHDWHVQPSCQRSLRLIRLSGAVWIEAQACAGVSSNLLRSPYSAPKSSYRRFCANLLKLSEFYLQVKLNLAFFRREPRSLRSVAQRKISKSDQQNMPEPLGLAGGINSWVLQWLVLCGIPYRGSGALASPDPTN